MTHASPTPVPAPGAGPLLGALARRTLGLSRRLVLNRSMLGYGQMLAGTGARLAIQAVYFFVLANTLSLRDMGVFASVSAAGVMLGCLTGFGFQISVFRAAAGRRSSLGAYLACFYAGVGLSLPISLLAAAVIYRAVFADAIPWPDFLAFMVVEVLLWRLVETLSLVNNGLGRYGAGAAVVTGSTGCRALAAVAFMLAGGGEVGRWALFYLAGNAAAVVVLAALYAPRIRLRWRSALMVGRLRASLLYALSYFTFLAQNEVDKIVILWLAGDRMAGLYAIAMRLVDLTAAPLRPAFVMYSCKLIKAGQVTRRILRQCLRVEVLVALVSSAGLAGVVTILHLWPGMLGRNVAVASGLLGVVALVPAMRNLMEFHGELFIAFDRMGLRSLLAATVVALKAAGLALVIVAAQGGDGWDVWLNAVYALPYVVSCIATYGLLWRAIPRPVPAVPVAAQVLEQPSC